MFNLFGEKPRADPGAIARVKGWAADLFNVPADATVMVTELRCAEDGCPDVETVIAVLGGRGPTRSHKVPKPAANVTREDVAALGPATPASDP
ncbi:MAG: hypothetical protein JWO38_2017 [Gemmataceae bacterium]|nr:hypothetical protein [Gemmataceae bacterium]